MNDVDLRPGTVLARRYEVVRRLGRGGVATVYLVEDRQRADSVALKLLSAERARDPDMIARFQTEMRIASALPAHPNIVRPLDHGEFAELGGRPYMTMEYAAGPTLADLVVAKPLAIDAALPIIIDVATALTFLHDAGIIHRDVKPTNIIVPPSGRDQPRAKLLDFGYAFDLDTLDTDGADRLTQIDERPGTKHYMAPEQARGDAPAPSFDVYALSVTLYEALVGHPPMHAHSPRDVVLRKCDPSLPGFSIAQERPDLPPRLISLVDQALRLEPAVRTSTAAAFGETARALLTERRASPAGLPSAATSTTSRRAPARPGSWMVWASFAVVGLVVISLGVFVWLSRSIPSEEVATPPPGGAAEPNMATHVVEPEQRTTEFGAPTEAPVPAPSASPSKPSPATQAEVHRPPRAPKPRPRPRPAAPAPAEPMAPAAAPKAACAEVQAEAQAAQRSRKWALVARLTRRSECWADSAERTRLRVAALYRLGRHEDCVRFGRASSDDEVQRTVGLCSRKLAKETTP